MMMKKIILILGLMVLMMGIVSAGEVYLGSQLDQTQGAIGSTYGVYENFTLNQTYEITGGKIYIGNIVSSGAMRIEIREIETNYTNMILNGTPLATTNNITATDGIDENQFFNFTFNLPITLDAGNEYWVAFYSADGFNCQFGGESTGVSWYWDFDYEYPTLWELTNGNDAYPNYTNSMTLYMAFNYVEPPSPPPVEETWSPTYEPNDIVPALFDGIGRMLLTFVAFAGIIVMILLGSWGFRKIKGKR
jgi:hypothetical protein